MTLGREEIHGIRSMGCNQVIFVARIAKIFNFLSSSSHEIKLVVNINNQQYQGRFQTLNHYNNKQVPHIANKIISFLLDLLKPANFSSNHKLQIKIFAKSINMSLLKCQIHIKPKFHILKIQVHRFEKVNLHICTQMTICPPSMNTLHHLREQQIRW